MRREQSLDFSGIKTYSAQNRINLVTIENMMTPGVTPHDEYNAENFDALIERILTARKNDRPVIWSMGAHVVKNRLSRYIIELMKMGIITHIAANGATSIHDFELAYLGGTSEDVPTAIEDGSFGMWEETGAWMNEAIKLGAEKNYGYGQSLADYVENNPDKFPYRDDCVFYRAYKMGVPVTYHVTMGTDIIHQHPSVDFEALGKTSGIDFNYFCYSLSTLGDNGVHLNIGSAVTGAEVFLKALSIARNQGNALKHITTANFDIIPLGDYKTDIGKDTFEYYYRPRKNIINRPVSLGGTGLYICGNHEQTIPSLYARLKG
ncbi:MAG: hypothetical protein IKM24_01325 [Clostridia bacterium]|nr:hypothetical protein [Clostridia bacterium]